MRSFLKSLIVVSCLSAMPAFAQDDLLRDLKEVGELLPGLYDNGLQRLAQENMGLPPELRLEHRTMFFAKIERPKSCCTGFDPGANALYFFMQIYREGKRWPTGDHVVVIYPDASEKVLVWQFVRVADPSKSVGLHKDVQMQRDVILKPQPADVLACPVLSKRVRPDYHYAELKNGGCEVISVESKKPRTLDMFLSLSPTGMTYMDRGLEKGVVVHGSLDRTPFSLARIPQ